MGIALVWRNYWIFRSTYKSHLLWNTIYTAFRFQIVNNHENVLPRHSYRQTGGNQNQEQALFFRVTWFSSFPPPLSALQKMSLTRVCDHVISALWPLIHQPYRVRRAASMTSRVYDVIRGRCVRAILRRQATFWGDRNRTGITSLDASKSDIRQVKTTMRQGYSESLLISAGVCRGEPVGEGCSRRYVVHTVAKRVGSL